MPTSSQTLIGAPQKTTRGPAVLSQLPYLYTDHMIFKAVGNQRPYPEHGLVTAKDWSQIVPRMVRLSELTTVKANLDLATLLAEDSTFFGDIFAHVVAWDGEMYLEDGLHRALRAALHQRATIHARVLDLNN